MKYSTIAARAAWLLGLLCLLATAALAQSVTLRGTVIDPINKTPLAGATVTVKGQRAGSVTAPDGTFTIAVRTNATHTLVVSMVGYEPQTIQAKPGDTFLTIPLTQGETALDEVVVGASRIEEKLVRAGPFGTRPRQRSTRGSTT